MKKYVVKKTYTALRSNVAFDKGYTESWYTTKEHSDKEFCEYIKNNAWSRKCFAEKYIQNDKDFERRMQQDFWKIDYEIIEIEG